MRLWATGDCSTWANACGLQAALDAAQVGDQIWVAPGTYTPTVGVGQYAAFTLTKSVALYGGFPATGTPVFGDRAPKTHVTTLSGDRLGNDGPNFTNNSENSYRVVTAIGVTQTGGAGRLHHHGR